MNFGRFVEEREDSRTGPESACRVGSDPGVGSPSVLELRAEERSRVSQRSSSEGRPSLVTPLQRQLGPIATHFARSLDRAGAPLWLDSGTLLGIVRDGEIPPWDKDIDVGVWINDVEAVREALTAIGASFGASWKERRLDGAPYAFVVTPDPADVENPLPIAVHVFRRERRTAVSEQPHFLLAHRAAYVRNALREVARACGAGARGAVIARVRSPRLALLEALGALRVRKVVRAWFRTRFRADADGVVPRHPLESPAYGWMHERFQWRVPCGVFDDLEAVPIGDASIGVPRQSESYLALRYGRSWRRPKRDWIYVLHDGALVPRDAASELED